MLWALAPVAVAVAVVLLSMFIKPDTPLVGPIFGRIEAAFLAVAPQWCPAAPRRTSRDRVVTRHTKGTLLALYANLKSDATTGRINPPPQPIPLPLHERCATPADRADRARRIRRRFFMPPPNPMMPSPVVKDIVLVGGGHSHAFVLKNFGMNPEDGVRVTLITRDLHTPYSGMLPGHVAGLYTKDECHIDLGKLARWAGVRLVHAEASGVDRENRLVRLTGDRPPIPYDVLSINIGSAPRVIEARTRRRLSVTAGCVQSKKFLFGGGETAITPVKPIDGFSGRWDQIVQRVVAIEQPVQFVVVGAGAGGIELTLSMQARLRKELQAAGKDPELVKFSVISRSKTLMPSHNPTMQGVFKKILESRGVQVLYGRAAVDVTETHVVCDDGTEVPFGECIWCTQAGAQEWLQHTGLQLSPDGFVAVNPTLESCNSKGVFACGDCAAVLEHPRPKAGVFAVRQGPPVAANLRRSVLGEALVPFVPQQLFLGIVGTGDEYGVASKGPITMEGKWLWELKDLIDRKWMWNYTGGLPIMQPVPGLQPS